MSNQELETFLQQMDSNMLLYGQSIQHVGITPQGEVEVRYIDPRSTVINGITPNHLIYDESGYTTGLESQIIQTTPRYYSSGLTEDTIRQFMIDLSTTTTSYTPTPIIHKSKYHKYDIQELKGFDNKETILKVKTPTKTFSIYTKNKHEYNRALQDAQFGNFKRWSNN